MYYFEYTTDKEPRGIIPLENIEVREVQDRSKSHCFELYAAGSEVIKACKTDSEGKVVEGKIAFKTDWTFIYCWLQIYFSSESNFVFLLKLHFKVKKKNSNYFIF